MTIQFTPRTSERYAVICDQICHADGTEIEALPAIKIVRKKPVAEVVASAPEPIIDKDPLCFPVIPSTIYDASSWAGIPFRIKARPVVYAEIKRTLIASELKWGDIIGSNRTRKFVDARQYIAAVMVNVGGYGIAEAGRIMRKDHTTILHATSRPKVIASIAEFKARLEAPETGDQYDILR